MIPDTPIATLVPPRPLELVAASEVQGLLETTARELTSLESTAAELRAAADSAEQEARERGADAGTSMWALVRLQGFLDDLRRETTRDVEAMLDVAHRQAAEHMRRRAPIRAPHPPARAAEVSVPTTLEARLVDSNGPVVVVVPDHGDDDAAAVGAVNLPSFRDEPDAVASDELWAREWARAAVRATTSGQASNEVPTLPTPVTNAVFAPPGLLDAEATDGGAAPPAPPLPSTPLAPLVREERAATQAAPDPSVLAPPQVPVPMAASEAVSAPNGSLAPSPGRQANEPETADAPQTTSRKRRLRALPLSAILEAAAVVLIGVFVLMRLG